MAEICAVEVGLLRKKPCGHASVAHCSNCEMPLCAEHAMPLLNEGGKRTGKFVCKECEAAAKEQEKSLAAVARAQEEKKRAAAMKAAADALAKPATPAKKPAAPGAAAKPGEAKPAEPEKKEPDALEFTPKDGNLTYTTRKKDEDNKPPE
jgi:hypothetical protein